MAYLLQKSVFLHTPKTAGQWVAKALENAGLIVGEIGVVHSSVEEIRDENEFKKRGFSFTFVRHPASWYQSMWAHRMDEEWTPIDDPEWFTPKWIDFWAQFTDRCRSNSFEEFVRKCVKYYPQGFVSDLFDAYASGCDFVGRQENLLEDLCQALDLAEEEYDTVKLLETRAKNVRSRKPYRQKQAEYTPELLELVARTEARALNEYEYEAGLPITRLS